MASGIGFLIISAAGIGLIITFVINYLNDVLLKRRISVIHPDTMISVDIYKIMNPVEAMKQGMYSLFLGGFVSVLVFMGLWLTPLFREFAGGNIWIGAAVYSFAIYIVMMLIFLPIVHRGFFGVLYHQRTPYWSFALLAVYAILLALLVPLVL